MMAEHSGTNVDLEDYSLYNQLSDDQLMQLAIERSLAEHGAPAIKTANCRPRPTSPSRSSSPFRSLPTLRLSSPPRHHLPPGNPSQLYVQLPANPASSQGPAVPPPFLSCYFNKSSTREYTQLQSMIFSGNAEAVMDIIHKNSACVTEPNQDGWIALHEAAYFGQLQCLRILIQSQPETVNRCCCSGQTPLLLAASRGFASCVEALLDHGADPNIPNKERDTPLFKACEKQNEQIVDILLQTGASVNRPCSQGSTALHEAAERGHLNICKMLLKSGANLSVTNAYGIQPFFTAAQSGELSVIKLFIEKGAEIDQPAADGATPLYEASKNGHVTIVETLLLQKANANQSTKSGLMPIHIAVKKNHSAIVSLLLPATTRNMVLQSGISPLHFAAEQNKGDVIQMLTDAGYEVNARLSEERSKMYQDRRSTALYMSVYNKNLEAAEKLLVAGANPNLDWFNPLLIAVRQGCIEMVTLLLEFGANVNAQISTKPLSFPAAILLSMEYLPMMKLLLDHGCNAYACFHCKFGSKAHPVIVAPRPRHEELRYSVEEQPIQHCMQFCEAVSNPSNCEWAGPILSLLLDYVGHVKLCSQLVELLESCSDWTPIKWKATPRQPLSQLCRLRIRRLVGVQRLKLINTLPLPGRLQRFLCYSL